MCSIRRAGCRPLLVQCSGALQVAGRGRSLSLEDGPGQPAKPGPSSAHPSSAQYHTRLQERANRPPCWHVSGSNPSHPGWGFSWLGPASVVRQRRASGRLAHRGGRLFHKAKGPAPFHSIESVDKLISIEDRDEPVHCISRVSRAWRVVFSEDAPGIFDRLQYSLLIRVVHGARLTERRLN